MLLDTQNLFSNAQAVTASAASENVVDMGLGEAAFGTPKPLLIQVTEDFATLTSLKVSVQTSDVAAFTSPVTLAESSLDLADLKAGTTFPINFLPKGNKGFVRLYYTVTGNNATAGKITAGIVAARDEAYQDI